MLTELVIWGSLSAALTLFSILCWCYPGWVLGKAATEVKYHRIYLVFSLLAVLVFISGFIFGSFFEIAKLRGL